MRNCLEPFHAWHLGTLKGRWVSDKTLLATAPKNTAIRESFQHVVAAAWDVYKKYIPYWTTSGVWMLPSDLQPWIRDEKVRLVKEASDSGRERMIDVENLKFEDFNWDQSVGMWSDLEDGDEYTEAESSHPQLDPLSDQAARTQLQDWASHTLFQLQGYLSEAHRSYCSDKKVDATAALQPFKRALLDTRHRATDVEKIYDDYGRTWDELSKLLLAKATQISNGNIATDLASWKHQRKLLEQHFADAESQYAVGRACAFPKGQKGIGHVLESASGRCSEVVETLLGVHLPSRDVRGCKLPRVVYPRVFAVRMEELEPTR